MSQAGRLLVATPLIGDPNFERTVVLLLAHGGDGAFGVVVNRPSDTAVFEVAEEWATQVAAPGVVFVGGLVALGCSAEETDVDVDVDVQLSQATAGVYVGFEPGQKAGAKAAVAAAGGQLH